MFVFPGFEEYEEGVCRNFELKMSSTITMDTLNTEDPTTLMGKWRKCLRTKPKGNKTKNVSRLIVVFLIVTTIYAELRYTIPYAYSEYDPWTVYYLKVLAVYFVIMFSANWLSCMLYGTAVENNGDQAIPSYYRSPALPLYHTSSQHHGIASQSDIYHDKDVLQWSYCQKCDLRTPPRAHHCDVCDKCILKRDHHCFFLGVCIGFKNQRYFVLMTFYAAVVCIWGLCLAFGYTRDHIYPYASFSDWLLPITIYRTVFGDISFQHFIMIYHIYAFTCFTPVAMFYFSSQFTIISKGVTLYELAKNVPVRNTNSIDKNFRSVFGDFWYVNFLIPAQILFRQNEDGYSWDGVKILNVTAK